MKKVYPLAIIIFFAGIVLFVFTRDGWRLSEKPAQTQQSSAAPISVLEAQTNSEGPVTVKITPKLSSEIAFEIILDTHSEELDADLVQVATLKDENGREYKPQRWEGDPPGGHHREGTLIFGVIKPVPKTLQLTVRQIGGIAEREFLWTIAP